MEPVSSPSHSSQNSPYRRTQEKGAKTPLNRSLSSFFKRIYSSDSHSNDSSSSSRTSPRSVFKSSSTKKNPDHEYSSESGKSIFEFASKYPPYFPPECPLTFGRRASEEEIRNDALVELRDRIASKVNQDTAKLIKKRLSQTTFEAMGNSVNHVFPIDSESSQSAEDGVKGRIAYLKCSRDGKANSSIMEKTASRLAKELDLSNFVESDVMYISPRSGEQLVIIEAAPSREGSSNKNSSQKTEQAVSRRRASSITRHFLQSDEIQSIGVTVSNAVEGKTLEEIYKETRNNQESSVLLNHFASINKRPVIDPKTKEEYRLHFIEGVLNSIIMGTSDAHRGNIILAKGGFFHLDQGRSIANSNMLQIWGDSLKLPYHSAFQTEPDFFSHLSEKEFEFISTFIKSVAKKAKKLENFFFHPIQKNDDGIDRLPPGWVHKNSTCEAIKDRIFRIESWVNKKLKFSLRKKMKLGTLDDLIQYIYPYQSFVTCLYATTRILPAHFLEKDLKGSNHDKYPLIDHIWQLATENSGKFQNQRDPLDGKIHDLLYLLDHFADIGFEVDDLHHHLLSSSLKSSTLGKELLIKFHDIMRTKLDSCIQAGLLDDITPYESKREETLFAKLKLYNNLRKIVLRCQELKTNEMQSKNSPIEDELQTILTQMIKAGLAPQHIIKGPKIIAAQWTLKQTSYDYLKTLFTAYDHIKGMPCRLSTEHKEKLKEIKLYLCSEARIDFKEITNTEYWLIRYLHRLCSIAAAPCLSNNSLASFSFDEDKNFASQAFSVLNNVFSKGYCISLYEMEKHEKNPMLLAVRCSISYLDSEGKLVRNMERLTVCVIEGDIHVIVRDGSAQYLVPFQNFLKEIEINYGADRKFAPDIPENLFYAQHLFPLEYFRSILTGGGIEYFNYDAFDITQEYFKEINDFILFFKRCYVLQKENSISLRYLDGEGREQSAPLEIKREGLTINFSNETYDFKQFADMINLIICRKEFRYGSYNITIGESEKMTIERDGISTKGTFHPGKLEIELGTEALTLKEFKAYLN